MKLRLLIGVVVLGLLLSRIALAANSYQLTRSTVSSGSAMSAGGGYTLGGTAGQMDAGQMASGSYILGGGFWGGGTVAAQNGHIRYLPLVVR
jgi:hypothetical protein